MISPESNAEVLHADDASARGKRKGAGQSSRHTTSFGGSNLPTLRIAETFVSRQGEGKLSGVESFFIRTSGCNLRCWFCDTPYASWDPEGDQTAIRAIVDHASTSGVKHVVLTGGEPLLPAASVFLCEQLRAAGFHITIETAGTVFRGLPSDLMSISPKFHGSGPDSQAHPRWARLHEERRRNFDVVERLIQQSRDFQIKFVVDNENDFDELLAWVAEAKIPREKIWVMPQGVAVDELDAATRWLRPWTRAQGFHYCDRMQIRWYGNRRGT